MWAQVVATAIGIWLYAAPGVLGYGGAAATSDRIAGPLAITFSFVAIWEFLRGVRLANRPLGAWLLVAPWILGAPADATASSMAAGAALLGLSLVRGEIEHRYGGGWRVLVRESDSRSAPLSGRTDGRA